MPAIQHDGARKLLRLISSPSTEKTPLTYKEAAKLLGRMPPASHSRAVAQMCDLLDAASALAGVPLLALVRVLASNHKINPKPWKEHRARRAAIIQRSRSYPFSKADFEAISAALKKLDGLGNRKAWKYVRRQFPGDALYRRITEPYPLRDIDAIDDFGTDAPDRAKTTGYVYARDPSVRKAVLKRAKGKCELCGEPGFHKADRTRYLECHHIIALAKEGKDRMSNVIALCPNDHREAHFGARGAEIEQEMIKKVRAIERQRTQ
jgi:hypothetical protein